MFKHKNVIPAVVLLVGMPVLGLVARAGQGSAGLTNADIIKMAQAKLSDGIIVAKIKSSPCAYDTGTDQLISLKQQGVSDAVIQAMAECGTSAGGHAKAAKAAKAAAAPSAVAAAAPSAGAVTEIGVYHKVGGEWQSMDPEIVNVKSGGVGKTILTVGIVKSDVNAHINGAHSGNQVQSPVEILIYTPEGVAASEYQLLRLRQQKDSREFRTMTGGVLHASSGDTKDQVQFEGKKIANRTYVVELGNLGSGEYGFLPPGGALTGSGGSVGKMYTFRVQ